jgi:hypothetical protein
MKARWSEQFLWGIAIFFAIVVVVKIAQLIELIECF